MSSTLDASFWNSKYSNNDIGWDIGYPSPPIAEYADQLERKDLSILIPGCGNGYEAEYLWNTGHKNVHILDYSDTALNEFKIRVPEFPTNQIHIGDFFTHQGSYDLILEQTFFCAIQPTLRQNYVHKVKELLKPEGKLVGVLLTMNLMRTSHHLGEFPRIPWLLSATFSTFIYEELLQFNRAKNSRELFVIFS